MPDIPNNRTVASTVSEHLQDHTDLANFNNLIDAAGDLIVGTGVNTAGRLPKGSALQSLRVNAAGTALEYATSSAGVLKDYASATKTNGNFGVPTASYSNVDTAIDLVLTAASGDLIEIGAFGMWDAGSQQAHLGPISVVSGLPVNNLWPGASAGVTSAVGWEALPVSVLRPFGGSFLYVAVAGDISGGTMTIRLRARLQVATGGRTLFANTIDCFNWWAKNYGPAPV